MVCIILEVSDPSDSERIPAQQKSTYAIDSRTKSPKRAPPEIEIFGGARLGKDDSRTKSPKRAPPEIEIFGGARLGIECSKFAKSPKTTRPN